MNKNELIRGDLTITDGFLVYKMIIQEEIGSAYYIDIYGAIKDKTPLIGGEIKVKTFELGYVTGIIIATQFNNKYDFIRIAHPLYKATKNIGYKVYENKNIKDIITSELPNISTNIDGGSKTYELLIRYNETSLNFVRRIMFYNGLYLKCNYDGSVTIKDQMKTEVELKFRQYDLTHGYYEYNIKKELSTTATRLYAYPIENPDANLTIEKGDLNTITKDFLETYKNKPEGNKILEYIRQSEENIILEAQTTEKLQLFNEVTIKNEKFTIFSIEHVWNFEEKEPTLVYTNSIKGFSKRYQMDFSVPTTNIHRAKVVTNDHEILFNQDKNSIRVQVPWGIFWAILSQEWCGNNRGTFFLPRKNDEVLISFVDGNCDKPFILKSLYNVANIGPIKEDECGIYTKTIDGEEHSSLVFSDTKNEQKVHLNITEGNMDFTLQKGDFKIDMNKGNNSLTIESGNHSINLKEGNLSVTTNGKIDISSTSNIHVSGPNISFEASDSFSIKTNKFTIESVSSENKSSTSKIETGSLDIKSSTFNLSTGTFGVKGTSVGLEAGSLSVKAGTAGLDCGSFGVKSAALTITAGTVSCDSTSVSINAGACSVNSGGVFSVSAGAVCSINAGAACSITSGGAVMLHGANGSPMMLPF